LLDPSRALGWRLAAILCRLAVIRTSRNDRASLRREEFMQRARTMSAVFAFLVLAVAALPAAIVQAQLPQPTSDPRVADLVAAGRLRVGLFLPQYVKDPTTGDLRSVWVETARALAARIGVPLTLVPHATPPEAIACLKAGGCDLIFLPFDARAAEIGDFSSPIFQFDYTLLVPPGSPIAKVAEVDRSGARIAAVRNHASTIELARQLKNATLVYADTPLDLGDRLPGARVLDDRYGANINRVVVPKGKAGWRAYVNAFVEQAKASGLVQQAIARGGTRGVTAAPLGDSN
jgi:polar amino acid transport system substrate-binding protein